MSKELFEKNLNKYSNKDVVLNKWIELNKRLNRNKDSTYYSRTILDAQGLVEYVINNVIKDDNGNVPNRDENGRYYGIVDKLIMTRGKGKIVHNNLVSRLKKIKYYRNVVAHNTKTTIDELVDYEKTEEALDVYGEILSCLDFLDRENIIVGIDKLKAQVGDVIDGVVTLDEFIGEGASGKVFKAYHKRLGVNVAIKEIKHNTVDANIIENEKKILISLKHKGIPNIYDVIAENRTYYIVMQYIDGITMEESVDKTGELSLKALIDIGKQLCDIIGYLHSEKVIYNDLKPSNIMIDNYNNLSLIDFGISCNVNDRSKLTNKYSGTYVYSSPEQLRGEIGSSSNDIYSLGATLYYISQGENPSASEEQRFKKSTDKRIVYIIEKAMNHNKSNRYDSVNDLKEDLLRVEKGKSPIVRIKDKNKNKIGMIVASIVLGCVLVVGGGIGIYKVLSQDKSKQVNTIEVESKNTKSNNEKNTKVNDEVNSLNNGVNKESSVSPKEVTSDEKSTSEEQNNKDKQTTNKDINKLGSTFNGQLVAKVTNYQVNGKEIIVNVNIKNNYDKEINCWPDGIYMMNENGKRFGMDIHKQLSSGGTHFNVVPGENKDFTFYLTDYVESNSLIFKLDKIWCMGPESMQNKIEIKVK